MGQTNIFAIEKCLILTCGEHYPLLGSTDAKQNTLQLLMIFFFFWGTINDLIRYI